MGRTTGARDGSQRKRRSKTQAEKDATAEAKRKKMAKGTASITDLFSPTTTTTAAATTTTTQQDDVDDEMGLKERDVAKHKRRKMQLLKPNGRRWLKARPL